MAKDVWHTSTGFTPIQKAWITRRINEAKAKIADLEERVKKLEAKRK